MSVKLLTEHHLEFLSFQGGCNGSFESRLYTCQNTTLLEITAATQMSSVDELSDNLLQTV